jgi:starvation-inducible DNA-binding protein
MKRFHRITAPVSSRFLLADHETIIRNLRKQISFFANEQEDLEASDFVTGLMQDHEKAAWFLRAHLDKR